MNHIKSTLLLFFLNFRVGARRPEEHFCVYEEFVTFNTSHMYRDKKCKIKFKKESIQDNIYLVMSYKKN